MDVDGPNLLSHPPLRVLFVILHLLLILFLLLFLLFLFFQTTPAGAHPIW